MIYLICAKDDKQRSVELNNSIDIKDNLYFQYILNSFEHKNVLYPKEFYTSVIKEVLPNRVNIVYVKCSNKKIPNYVNAIVLNNKKEIIKTYKNDIDDVYIFATQQWILEEFCDIADYIIVFVSDKIGYTLQFLPDIIDFSNYNLIRSENPIDKDYRIEYYVTNKTGK